MKTLTFAAMGTGGFTLLLAAAGFFVSLNLDHALARYPGSRTVGEQKFGLLSVSEGRISQASTYRTQSGLYDVWEWYYEHYGIELLDQSFDRRAQCLSATHTGQYLFVQREVNATICSRRRGTMVYVNQTINFWP